MIEERINSLLICSFQNLSRYGEIHHFVSTRTGGFSTAPYASLNLALHVGDDPKKVLKNRERLASALRIPLSNFTIGEQIHSGNVRVISDQLRGIGSVDHKRAINGTDAMVTNVSNIALMVLLADCVPILFFDPVKRVIGVAHAGWRGTIRLVAQNTVRVFRERFGTSPTDIAVALGPSIGPCCYEVGPEVAGQVQRILRAKSSKRGYINKESSDSKAYFNLWEANKGQLLRVGIPEENIEIAGVCTNCNSDLFFSRRHQKGPTARFGAAIMIR